MPIDPPKTFGPFRLRVDPVRAAAFAREIGADEREAPLAYPAIWIVDPELFQPVREICAMLDVVPVHESQSFSYAAPLALGALYDVSLALRREETPPRLIVDATIAALDGETIACSETMLRLVPRSGFGGAAP